MSHLVRKPGIEKGTELSIVVIMAGFALFGAYLLSIGGSSASSTGKLLALLAIAGCSISSLYSLWKMTFSTARRMSRISLKVTTQRVRRGDQVEVLVDTGGLQNLEVGLVYTEIAVIRGEKISTESSTIIERFQPAVDGTVLIPTLPTDPINYPGKDVALHCLAELRSTKTKHGSTRVNVTVGA